MRQLAPADQACAFALVLTNICLLAQLITSFRLPLQVSAADAGYPLLSAIESRSPATPFSRSQFSRQPSPTSLPQSQDGEAEAPVEPMKQALGFLPPPDERGTAAAALLAGSTRRRKTRSKKHLLAMTGGE